MVLSDLVEKKAGAPEPEPSSAVNLVVEEIPSDGEEEIPALEDEYAVRASRPVTVEGHRARESQRAIEALHVVEDRSIRIPESCNGRTN